MADYHFASGAVIQLVATSARAGQSLLTLDFDDLERELAAIHERGLKTSSLDDTTSDKVLIATVSDPDGNAITLVQQRQSIGTIETGGTGRSTATGATSSASRRERS